MRGPAPTLRLRVAQRRNEMQAPAVLRSVAAGDGVDSVFFDSVISANRESSYFCGQGWR